MHNIAYYVILRVYNLLFYGEEPFLYRTYRHVKSNIQKCKGLLQNFQGFEAKIILVSSSHFDLTCS